MITARTVTLHERYVIADALESAMDDAASAYLLLTSLEEEMTSSDYRSEERQMFVPSTIHAARGMIHNLLMSYLATVGDTRLGESDMFGIELKELQESMNASHMMHALVTIAAIKRERRQDVSDLPAEEAIRELVKA